MASLNRVFLIGNLTRDPEVTYLPSGRPVAKLGLAVSRKYTSSADNEQKEEVCFVNVVVWGKQAEPCGQYLVKGRPVFIEGRLQYVEWKTKDGQKRSGLKVVAERVQFLGSPKGGGESGDGAARDQAAAPRERVAGKAASVAPQATEEAPPDDAPSAGVPADADDLPF
jgi:single-strand DNA-binding protein